MRFVICTLLMVVFPLQLVLAKKVVYRKTQEVSFDETNIDGVARTPDGAYLSQRRGVKFLPLYRVKKNFTKEIKDSVEYLR